MFGSANKSWKRHFRYIRQIWLDREQQSENTKPVLLWQDSGHELDRKDVEDFFLFPTVFMCLHMINGSGDMLYWNWWKMLEFWAGQIQSKLIILIFWQRFEMKAQGTLNTKRVDIFLRFPMNIGVSHANKPSNGYGHWKTVRDKIFDGNLETDWVLEEGRKIWFENRTKITVWRKRGCFVIIPNRIACGSRSEEC
jgi:hypothetical protein